MSSRYRAVILPLLLSGLPLAADVKLPAVVSDHMLLQRGTPARIFGWAEPGESVTVQFHGQTRNTTTPANGRWQVWLNPLNAGDAGEMTIAGRNTVTVRDVLVGEVWVGSGQSNMQWALRQTNNAETEARNANYPQIRLFYVPRKTATEDPLASLSRREFEVFSFLVDGLRPKDIAKLLDISPKTVDTYRSNIMRKLGIHDLVGLVKFAIHRNLTSASNPPSSS